MYVRTGQEDRRARAWRVVRYGTVDSQTKLEGT